MVRKACWSSVNSTWTLHVDRKQGGDATFACRFLLFCTGYYDYKEGYSPVFPGQESFRGQIIHPQKWPASLDYRDKTIVVIGSGATAVTLVPELAKQAKHVTMLQRTPTYMASLPSVDPLNKTIRAWLPSFVASFLLRWKSIILSAYFYWKCIKEPLKARELLMSIPRRFLGPDFDVDTHFNPPYNPWEQRLCLVPDGDFYLAIRDKKASIVTDQVESISESGIRLRKAATELPADIIVTATGLQLQAFGGIEISVDGSVVDISKQLVYKGVLVSNVPNMMILLGYTNATWTLKCDLAFEYFCKLIAYMDSRKFKTCMPRLTESEKSQYKDAPELPSLFNLSSGYIQRAKEGSLRQGLAHPWFYNQNFFLDYRTLIWGGISDEHLSFS
jgi:monooxygenase